MRSLNTCPYWSIRREAPVSVQRRSTMPTACIQHYTVYAGVHAVSSLQRPGVWGMSLVETSLVLLVARTTCICTQLDGLEPSDVDGSMAG